MKSFTSAVVLLLTVEGVDELGPTRIGKLLEPIPAPISTFFDFRKTAKPLFLVPEVDQAVADRTRLGNYLSLTVMSVCRARVTVCCFMLALEQATNSIKPPFQLLKLRKTVAA